MAVRRNFVPKSYEIGRKKLSPVGRRKKTWRCGGISSQKAMKLEEKAVTGRSTEKDMAACGGISSPKAMKLDEKKQSRKSCKYELQFICCDDILNVQL